MLILQVAKTRVRTYVRNYGCITLLGDSHACTNVGMCNVDKHVRSYVRMHECINELG